MGNRPFKPAFEPGQVTRLADVETSSILAKRFDALARRTGPDRTSFKVEDLIALVSTTSMSVVVAARAFERVQHNQICAWWPYWRYLAGPWVHREVGSHASYALVRYYGY